MHFDHLIFRCQKKICTVNSSSPKKILGKMCDLHHNEHSYLFLKLFFHLQRAVASCPKIQRLNPLVSVHGTDGSLASVLQNKEEARKLLSQYDIVCLVGQRQSHVLAVDALCRELGIKCFAARAFGLLGLILFDLGLHHRYTEPPDALDLAPKPKPKTSAPRCACCYT